MSLEDRDWYRAEMKRRSRPAVGMWPRRRWHWRSWLGNHLTIWLGVLIVVIAASAVDRVIDETRVADPELPNVIVPSRTAHPPQNCGEARSLGLQNIPRGSPYYAPWLDADNDGLACEPWPRRG
jgi:hypothetical protein